MEQDGFLFIRRDLDEAKSSEQENSFNSQQGVTDFMHIATFRSKGIEQFAVIASHRLQHVRGMHQRGYEKGRHLRCGIVLFQCFLDMGENQFDWPNRPAAQPSTHRLLKARDFPFQRRIHQFILSREAIDKTALADAGAFGDGVKREISASRSEDHRLGGIQDSIPIDFLFSRQTAPLLFRLLSRITISD